MPKYVIVVSAESEPRQYLCSFDLGTGEPKYTTSLQDALKAETIGEVENMINVPTPLVGARVFVYYNSQNRGGGRGRITPLGH